MSVPGDSAGPEAVLTANGPATDRLTGDERAEAGDVTAFWRGLRLPGLIDLHVHFMPDNVLAKVWAFFTEGRAGDRWPIEYQLPEPRRLALLRGFGVRRFGALLYPHKPDMAAWLNGWAAQFAARVPDALHTATFFPEPAAATYVARAITDGARLFKAHVQVGGYDPRDELLDEVWGTLAQARVPVVVHCGSGPHPGAYTGPGPIAQVLARHPGLVLVVAHLGAPEYGEFLDLAERYDGVYLDTTMAFTDFMNAIAPFPARLTPRLAALGGKIVLGTDFPNIPYRYLAQLTALAGLDLGEDWLRAVCYHNAAALLGE
ncbi:MAG: amidohydrolase family protein [Streptosporangiaceae bacterium]